MPQVASNLWFHGTFDKCVHWRFCTCSYQTHFYHHIGNPICDGGGMTCCIHYSPQKNISSIKNNGFSHQMVVSNPWWYPQISRHDWLLVFFNNHGWPKPRTPAAIDPRHRASWDFWSPPTGLYVHPLGSSRAFPRRRYQLYLKQGEYLPQWIGFERKSRGNAHMFMGKHMVSYRFSQRNPLNTIYL